jgi:methylmalonyl-CoA/ethylmalonyl-CoA epimerase
MLSNIIYKQTYRIHHIGYAVQNIENASKIFAMLDYEQKSDVVDDHSRNLKILFLNNNDTLIELISILDKTKKSPIDFLFKKRFSFPGEGIPYHICYLVNNIDQAVIDLSEKGFMTIQFRTKAPAIESGDVAFLFHNDIGIIELLEEGV